MSGWSWPEEDIRFTLAGGRSPSRWVPGRLPDPTERALLEVALDKVLGPRPDHAPVLQSEPAPGLPPLGQVPAAVPWTVGAGLLDSGGGSAADGGGSYLLGMPVATVTAHGRSVRIDGPGGMARVEADPWEALQAFADRLRMGDTPAGTGSDGFGGGLVVHLGFELMRHLDDFPTATEEGDLPDLLAAAHDTVLEWRDDGAGVAGRSRWVEGWPRPAGAGDPRERVRAMARDARTAEPVPAGGGDPGPLEVSHDPDRFRAMVEQVRGRIAAGEAFQVNVARRITAPWTADPRCLFARLRTVSPAPFAGVLALPGGAVVSSSPERFLRVQGRRLESRPIKGTRPRGADPDADAHLRRELEASAKDRAELNMIVDLSRNDLGRVAEIGTVRVDSAGHVESNAQVHHRTGVVTADLREDLGVLDAVRAAFPPASVTGAPKLRAVEILTELEGFRRGPYCGSLGWWDVRGDMDLNVGIRTISVTGGRARICTGGGITWDSDPHEEWLETVHKAAGMLEAVGAEPEDTTR